MPPNLPHLLQKLAALPTRKHSLHDLSLARRPHRSLCLLEFLVQAVELEVLGSPFGRFGSFAEIIPDYLPVEEDL